MTFPLLLSPLVATSLFSMSLFLFYHICQFAFFYLLICFFWGRGMDSIIYLTIHPLVKHLHCILIFTIGNSTARKFFCLLFFLIQEALATLRIATFPLVFSKLSPVHFSSRAVWNLSLSQIDLTVVWQVDFIHYLVPTSLCTTLLNSYLLLISFRFIFHPQIPEHLNQEKQSYLSSPLVLLTFWLMVTCCELLFCALEDVQQNPWSVPRRRQ